jgi:hypothetical protein
MPGIKIKRAKLLEIYRDRARNQANMKPYYDKFLNLIKTNCYPHTLIYNIDETSLVVKSFFRHAVIWKEGMCSPSFNPSDLIFSCTAIFVVCADGGHFESTLLLNEKADMSALSSFGRTEVRVRFIYLFIYIYILGKLKVDGSIKKSLKRLLLIL